MKTHIYIPALLLLLLAAACNTSGDPIAHKQPLAAFAHDSLWTPTGYAPLDSLLRLAAVSPQDTTLADLYYKIGTIYSNNNHEKAKEYFLKLSTLSEQLNWNKGRFLFCFGFSGLLSREGLRDSSIVILQNGLEIAKRVNDDIYIATFLGSLGGIYRAKEWYETALSYSLESIKILERTNDYRLKNLYTSISLIYGAIYNNEKAVEYGEKALALDSENEVALFALGATYLVASQHDKAVFYLEKALLLSEAKNNNYMKGYVYRNLGICALAAFDLKKAETYALQSLEINQQLGPDSYCSNYTLLSRLEQMKGNYDKAESYARKALEIATEYKLNERKVCYQILTELAIAKRYYSESLGYLIEFDLIEIEIAHHNTLRATEEMAAKYETEKKQIEIERQQSVIARQNMQRWLLTGGVALCVVILALLWYMLRLRNRSNTALLEMNATKDKFFNIISHDLKNPTHALHDNLKLLVHNARLWDADMISDFGNELLKSSEGQVELLNSLLSWARIQTGRITCTPVAFDLAARLRTDVALVRKLADNKQITLHAQMPDDATVTADANMILTVVRNLLTNAVKFTPAGGTVTLDVSPSGGGRDVARNVPTGYTVSVTDTGTGMTSEQIENLFRLDKHHTSRGTAGEEGSGLGLIVCKELLGMHGSALHVESGEGSGSRFWFEI